MKRPFDIDVAIERLREAVEPFPRAMLFQLYDDGHTSAFEMLVACLISVRTRDETSLAMAQALFARARTPAEMAALDINDIDALIGKCAFHLVKSEQINTMARLIVEENAGELPCSFEVMTSYPGIGPKCANLALGIACGQPRIGVDIHVHRITNRWGYVTTATPEATTGASWKRSSPRSTGSRSTPCSSRSARTSAPRSARSARSARCWICARSGAWSLPAEVTHNTGAMDYIRQVDQGALAAAAPGERFSQWLLDQDSGAQHCSINYIRTPAGMGSPAGMHTHVVDQIFYILSGTMSLEIDDTPYEAARAHSSFSRRVSHIATGTAARNRPSTWRSMCPCRIRRRRSPSPWHQPGHSDRMPRQMALVGFLQAQNCTNLPASWRHPESRDRLSVGGLLSRDRSRARGR